MGAMVDPEPFVLSSGAFASGGPIPRRHTCDGEDVSPPLQWGDPPAGTASLALEIADPDAPRGTFTHWIGWGLDPGARSLPEGAALPREGRNDFGATGYRGPCPPPGHGPHRYVFRLHALDRAPSLPPGAGVAEFHRALAAIGLGVAELVGTYARAAGRR